MPAVGKRGAPLAPLLRGGGGAGSAWLIGCVNGRWSGTRPGSSGNGAGMRGGGAEWGGATPRVVDTCPPRGLRSEGASAVGAAMRCVGWRIIPVRAMSGSSSAA